jgi:DNA-binding MarR family transcriptional regulator
MTPTALHTLEILASVGPRRITELARAAGITQPSMTALINTLDRSGMVTRRKDPSDTRARLVAITAAGAEIVKVRQQHLVSMYAELLDQLSTDEIEALAEALPAINRLSELTNKQHRGVSVDRRTIIPSIPVARLSHLCGKGDLSVNLLC